MVHPVGGIDPALKDYGATERQCQIIDAINEHGSIAAAARALGIDKGNVGKSMQGLQRRAAALGYAPGHFSAGVAPGYRMGKVTIQRTPEGVERVWERQHPAQEAMKDAVREFVSALLEDQPLPEGSASPKTDTADLLATYVFGDPHFGMKAIAAEAGEDFGLDEADRLTRRGIDRLADAAPATRQALLIVVGDNTHANDSSHLTPQHRNPLDMDEGGHKRSVLVSAKAWAYVVKRLLAKHELVTVWFMPGNHDSDTAFALSVCLSMFFEDEPRLSVDLNVDLYRCMRFGKVLIGAHHGDKVKPGDLPLLMAVDFAEDWGAASARYIYMGHIHHDAVKEIQGVRVEAVRTLAGKDAWHAGKGYRSMRDTRVIIHHKDYGEVERHTVSAAMLGRAA
jgi:UDP-2,3-diacylglucosamine pyrophosphatase LpxH